MSDDPDADADPDPLKGLDPDQVAALYRMLKLGQDEPDTPPTHTVPLLTDQVWDYISKIQFQIVLIIFAHPGRGLYRIHEELGELLEKNSFKVQGRLAYVEKHQSAATRYHVNVRECPTYIIFRQGKEIKRFSYSEYEECKAFLESHIAAATSRKVIGGSTTQDQFLHPNPSPPPVRLPPPKPNAIPPPRQNPIPPPAQKSTIKTPPSSPRPPSSPPSPKDTEPPWAHFRLKRLPGFQLTPEQQELKDCLKQDDFNDQELDLAFQETKSIDMAEIVDWIAQYQLDGELWAETDWIMAGRPPPDPIVGPKPEPVAPVKSNPPPPTAPKVAPKAAPKAAPKVAPKAAPKVAGQVTIRFNISGRSVDYSFLPTAKLGEVVLKLQENDVPAGSKLEFRAPYGGPPFGPDDYGKTLEGLKLQGRLLLNTTILS